MQADLGAARAVDIINLSKYPIQNLETAGAQKLIDHCRAELEQNGACELKQFVTTAAVESLVSDGVSLEPLAFHNHLMGNAYLDQPDPELPADHVRRMEAPTSLGAVAYDQFPRTSLLRQIFEWDPMMLFIGRVLRLSKIFRYADPMGALNLSVMKAGDYLRWHFDQTDFVSSLAIRSSEAGGNFEYVPLIRNATDENYEKVRATLRGSREGVVEIANEPGTLLLFKGRHSIHRVTEIKGNTSRLIGLFGFDSRPGVVSSEHLRKIRYGRMQARPLEV